MVGARFDVDLAALQLAAEEVSRAAAAARSLRAHPGVLAGRAADAGDEELREALVALGTRWDWGWGVVGGEADRWAALLDAAAQTYAAVERTVATS